MLLSEEDQALLKVWILKRLANVSWPEDDDVDLEVLCEYVLLLVAHDLPDEEVRNLCLHELPDILPSKVIPDFVNDLFRALKSRSYAPKAHPPRSRSPKRASTKMSQIPPTPPAAPRLHPSRKRLFADRDEGDGVPPPGPRAPAAHGSRPTKQARGRAGKLDGSVSAFNPGDASFAPQQFPMFPFDPSNPMAAFMPYTAALMQPLFSEKTRGSGRKPCKYWQQRGFCQFGPKCKYSHESPAMPAGLPFGDPSASALPFPFAFGNGLAQSNGMPQGNSLPPAIPNGKQQAPPYVKNKGDVLAAADGPVFDKSRTTIIVKGIPQENFWEDQVQAFFSQFGDIVELSLHPHKRMAKIKYSTWDEANAAYRSPKVMFDNRFVKVFWLKDDSPDDFPDKKSTANGSHTRHLTNGHASNDFDARIEDTDGMKTEDEELAFDMDQFLEKQKVAQQLHDDRVAKKKELRQRQEDLVTRLRELSLKRADAKQKLRAKLGDEADDVLSDRSESPDIVLGGTSTPSAQTEAIRAQLAALEAEALSLGIDPNEQEEPAAYWAPKGRGRGGRGYMPRGRGPFLGLDVNSRHSAYAAYSLDNRPKRVALSGVDFSNPKQDEALRQYLLVNGDFTDIEVNATTAVVSFSDRRAAEKFYYSIGSSKTIPNIDGVIELAWVTGPSPTSARGTTAPAVPAKNGNLDGTLPKAEAHGQSAEVNVGAHSHDDEEEGEIVEHEHMDFDVGADW